MLGPAVGKKVKATGLNPTVEQQREGKTLNKLYNQNKTFHLIYPSTRVFYQENTPTHTNNCSNTHRYRTAQTATILRTAHTDIFILTGVHFVE